MITHEKILQMYLTKHKKKEKNFIFMHSSGNRIKIINISLVWKIKGDRKLLLLCKEMIMADWEQEKKIQVLILLSEKIDTQRSVFKNDIVGMMKNFFLLSSEH